jgi:hypothetical protein
MNRPGARMDVQQLATILKELGLPAAISAVLTVLVKALSDVRQRRSKESLLDWLTQASAVEPFKGDERALRALHELQQSLVFERAFGLKAESTLRNELLAFAEANHESLKFQEVLDAGRLISRVPLARLRDPKRIKAARMLSKGFKPIGYLWIGIGYLWFIVAMSLPVARGWSSGQVLTWVAVGFVYGGLAVWLGVYMLKQSRRYEITAGFLGSRSEKTDGEGSDAA